MGETGKFFLNVAAVLVIAGVLVRIGFIELVTVPHNGMAPTLIYGDEVLVWKGAHVDMADVMVCEHPARPGQMVIGRAVAFAGHTIHTDRNGLYVDRDLSVTQPVARQHFYDATHLRLWDMELRQIDYMGKHSHDYYIQAGDSFNLMSYTIEKGFYMLGDNRADPSNDSREFGEVDPAHCLGQVFLRWRPAPPAAEDDIRHHRLDIIQ